MEDDPIVVANGRRPQYFPNWKTTSIIWENGRRPQLSDKLKMTLIISKWKITQLFWQMKNDLVFIYLSQPRLELSLAQLRPILFSFNVDNPQKFLLFPFAFLLRGFFSLRLFIIIYGDLVQLLVCVGKQQETQYRELRFQ